MMTYLLDKLTFEHICYTRLTLAILSHTKLHWDVVTCIHSAKSSPCVGQLPWGKMERHPWDLVMILHNLSVITAKCV